MSIDTIRLAPCWGGLLKGRRNLRILDINGAKIDISKGSDGVWNFEKIKNQLSGGKSGTELFIDHLLLNNSDILVNGKGLRGISLKLRDVATKGSADSKSKSFFDDESGNRYTVTGSFRTGLNPDAEFSLNAPSLNLACLKGVNKHFVFSGGTGTLQVNTTLHEGFLRSSIAVTLRDAAVNTGEGAETPLSGSLKSTVTYDMQRELLNLEDVLFTLDETLNMRVKGSMDSLKSGLRYDLVMGINQIAIARGAGLLTGLHKYFSKASGTLSAEKIRITGSMKHGVASINGMISLRDLLLARNGKLLVSGMNTDVKIATIKDSIQVVGELTQKKSMGNPLIERINAPYKVIISNKMNLKAVDFPVFTPEYQGCRSPETSQSDLKRRSPFHFL